jgi:hypothetical protein
MSFYGYKRTKTLNPNTIKKRTTSIEIFSLVLMDLCKDFILGTVATTTKGRM